MKQELEEIRLLVGIEDLLDRIEQSAGDAEDAAIAMLAALNTVHAILRMRGSGAAESMCRWMVIWVDEVRDAPISEIKTRTEALIARIAK